MERGVFSIMQTIYKYRIVLGNGTRTELELPIGSSILHAALQGDEAYVWALIDPDDPIRENITIISYGTGYIILRATHWKQYINTIHDGLYVWHVFVMVEQ